MKYGIHTLDDFDVRGKTVLMRIDINQMCIRDRDRSILFAGSWYAFVCRLFCCPKAGYNGMIGWMGYDRAMISL